jgi:hypothetical protein
LLLKRFDLEHLNQFSEYHSFNQEKTDGDKRKITAPNDKLKKVQRRILTLLTPINRPEWLMAGERGKSYIDNAMRHCKSDYFLTIDIRKFYDNCKRENIYRFIVDSLQTSNDVAGKLTDLMTMEGGIPTGAPTSQLMAYYAYSDMFNKIADEATRQGCRFSLYVDDMTFSSNVPFDPKKLANNIDIILRRYGHKPKYKKVKYYSRGKIKIITGVGITADHRLTVPNKRRHDIVKNYKVLKTSSENIQAELPSLKGKLNSALQIEAEIFPEIRKDAKRMI